MPISGSANRRALIPKALGAEDSGGGPWLGTPPLGARVKTNSDTLQY